MWCFHYRWQVNNTVNTKHWRNPLRSFKLPTLRAKLALVRLRIPLDCAHNKNNINIKKELQIKLTMGDHIHRIYLSILASSHGGDLLRVRWSPLGGGRAKRSLGSGAAIYMHAFFYIKKPCMHMVVHDMYIFLLR
jgi:hypothetical protein